MITTFFNFFEFIFLTYCIYSIIVHFILMVQSSQKVLSLSKLYPLVLQPLNFNKIVSRFVQIVRLIFKNK